MTITLEQASEIVKLRNLSDIAFFHKLESLGLPATFAVNYSLEELRRAET